jgi:hypothetical protein
MTGAAVNDAPVLGNNSFAITDGATLVLTGANLSATDVDDPAGSLVFTVSGVTHGQFQRLGVPVLTFTQAELVAGQVQFVHDGSGLAPAFMLAVSDAAAAVDGPYVGGIVFTAAGGGSAGGSGAGASGLGDAILITLPQAAPIVLLSFRSDVLPHPLLPLVTPVAQEFLRTPAAPAKDGRVDTDAAPASSATPTDDTPVEPARRPAPSPVAPRAPDAPPERAPLRHAPRAPTRHAAVLEGTTGHGSEAAAAAIRVTGIVASIAAAPGIARAAELVAKLLASSPGVGRFGVPRALECKKPKKKRKTARISGSRRPAKRAKTLRSGRR